MHVDLERSIDDTAKHLNDHGNQALMTPALPESRMGSLTGQALVQHAERRPSLHTESAPVEPAYRIRAVKGWMHVASTTAINSSDRDGAELSEVRLSEATKAAQHATAQGNRLRVQCQRLATTNAILMTICALDALLWEQGSHVPVRGLVLLMASTLWCGTRCPQRGAANPGAPQALHVLELQDKFSHARLA